MAYDENPNFTDRLLAAAIALIFAWPVGSGVRALFSFVGINSDFFLWLTLIGFSIFAFLAPRQSRDLLTQLWHGIIGVIRDLRLW